MKTLLSVVALLVLASILGLASNTLREEPLPIFRPLPELRRSEISLKEAFALFAQKKAVFLDARSPQAYRSGKIIGALNLPPGEFETQYPQMAGGLNRSTLITYCDGPRCPKAQALAELLRTKVHQKVFVLKDGFATWKNGGYPTN